MYTNCDACGSGIYADEIVFQVYVTKAGNYTDCMNPAYACSPECLHDLADNPPESQDE